MVEYVGKYNLDFAGKAGNNDEYEMLIVSEFDKLGKEIDRKTFYLSNTIDEIKQLLDNEYQIAELMQKPNNSKIFMYKKIEIICR